MSVETEQELTETPIENFIAVMRFVAQHDLFEAGEEAFAAAGISTITVSSEPIRVFKKMVADDVLANDRLSSEAGRRQAVVIAECGCGVAPPGPGHGPEHPHGGHPPDGGVPETLPPDAGGGG